MTHFFRAFFAAAIILLLALVPLVPPAAGQEVRLFALGFVWFNVRSAPFNNVAVRRAVAAAIDRMQVAQAADNEPALRLVPPGCIGATPTERNPYNPEQAKELLAQGGIRAEDLGEIVQWVITSPKEKPIEDMIGSHLRAIGLRVTQRQASGTQALRGTAGGFWYMTMLTDSCLRRNLVESLVHSRGQLNLTGYSSADVDALINRAQATNDVETRRRLFAEAEQKVLDDAALVPVWWFLSPRSYPARATASDRGVTVSVTTVTLDRELTKLALTVENGTDTELDLLPVITSATLIDEWGKAYDASATASTLPSQMAARSSRSGTLAFRGVRVGAVKLQLTLPGIRVGDETLMLRLDVSPP